MNTAAEKQSNQSAEKVLQIMECIAQNRIPIRLQDLAEQVNMSQSTVLRYLYSLQNANYVYQDEETSRYALTWKVCSLSTGLNTYSSLRMIANPFIEEIASRYQVGSCLVVNENSECFYLDCIDTPNDTRSTLQRIGKQAPLHATSSGKLLLSQYTRSQFEEYVEVKGLEKLTEHTISDPDVLWAELVKTRERNYGSELEECEIGLRCISSPLYNYENRMIAAISVFANKNAYSQEYFEETLLPALQSVTRIVSSRLGYIEDADDTCQSVLAR